MTVILRISETAKILGISNMAIILGLSNTEMILGVSNMAVVLGTSKIEMILGISNMALILGKCNMPITHIMLSESIFHFQLVVVAVSIATTRRLLIFYYISLLQINK